MPGEEDILIEVVPHPGLAGDLSPADLVDRFSGRVGELGRALASVASQLRETLEGNLSEPADGDWALSEVSLEMSINLEAEAGVIISRARAGAALQATLTWSRHEPRGPVAPGAVSGSAEDQPSVDVI